MKNYVKCFWLWPTKNPMNINFTCLAPQHNGTERLRLALTALWAYNNGVQIQKIFTPSGFKITYDETWEKFLSPLFHLILMEKSHGTSMWIAFIWTGLLTAFRYLYAQMKDLDWWAIYFEFMNQIFIVMFFTFSHNSSLVICFKRT